MKMSTPAYRRYQSAKREEQARTTRAAILDAARQLFSAHGIDPVTIAQIGGEAGVSASTIYSLFKSKDGVLRAIIEASLFGDRYQQALRLLDGETDPVRMIGLSAHVARAIYESEQVELGLLRGISGFSPALMTLEQELEATRYRLQEERLQLLFAGGRACKDLSLDDARRILWMYTSRDIFRMLVVDGGWSPERYQQWLEATLVSALVSALVEEGIEAGPENRSSI